MAQISEGMNTDLVTVEPSTGVVEAAQRMIQEEKGPLPVVEGERAVGMVTDRDLVARVVAEGADPNALSVGDIMSTDLMTATPDEDLDEARRLLAQHELDRLLVVEGDRLVGIISEADLRGEEEPLA